MRSHARFEEKLIKLCPGRLFLNCSIEERSDTSALPLIMAIETVDMAVALQFGESNQDAFMIHDKRIFSSQLLDPTVGGMFRGPSGNLLPRVIQPVDVAHRVAAKLPKLLFLTGLVPSDGHAKSARPYLPPGHLGNLPNSC